MMMSSRRAITRVVPARISDSLVRGPVSSQLDRRDDTASAITVSERADPDLDAVTELQFSGS